MYVNSLDDDLVRYLIGDTEAPDSVIDTPFSSHQIFSQNYNLILIFQFTLSRQYYSELNSE